MGTALEPGLQHEVQIEVTAATLATCYAAGTVEAYASPALVGLIERTAAELVAPYLKEGETTVGTQMTLRHLAATPLGMQVRCLAQLTEIDRRRLVFKAEAWDDVEKIGEATHERFVVNRAFFEQKLADKAKRPRP